VNSRLQFRYDLGSDDLVVSLPGVNVSDGMRHVARVSRYGNQAVLRLDSGEGRFYAEHWPTSEHQTLRLQDASAGGEVIRNVWTSGISTHSIVDSMLLFLASEIVCLHFNDGFPGDWVFPWFAASSYSVRGP